MSMVELSWDIKSEYLVTELMQGAWRAQQNGHDSPEAYEYVCQRYDIETVIAHMQLLADEGYCEGVLAYRWGEEKPLGKLSQSACNDYMIMRFVHMGPLTPMGVKYAARHKELQVMDLDVQHFIPFPSAPIVERLKNLYETDQEEAHITADGILCEMLDRLGYSDVVDAYDGVPKWYA
ncbi:hypothetical protein [Bifidobacterium cuniculi]|uniref:Uncharacterized protein n=1 Tax=Bifidobacterium cuniculi TaxID=1688 RepID=A0A087B4X5_9BIFI|nr:hypothetical protein [Bifidobacterium cuniculi]KFI66075.1 hypothetical protein BCUN_0577 [Bifidobacterium cuniculi]